MLPGLAAATTFMSCVNVRIAVICTASGVSGFRRSQSINKYGRGGKQSRISIRQRETPRRRFRICGVLCRRAVPTESAIDGPVPVLPAHERGADCLASYRGQTEPPADLTSLDHGRSGAFGQYIHAC